MNVTVYDPSGKVLMESEADWEPFTETIYGNWVDTGFVNGEETGFHPVLGTRAGERLTVLSYPPTHMVVQRITTDGADVDLGVAPPIWVTPGTKMALDRNVTEERVEDPA